MCLFCSCLFLANPITQEQTKTLENRCAELLTLTETQKTEKERLEVKIFESVEVEKNNAEVIEKLKEELSGTQLTLKTKEEEFVEQNQANESLITGLRTELDQLKAEASNLQVKDLGF